MRQISTGAREGKRFIALALITMVLALSSGDRATLSVAGPLMSKDLGITSVELGWLFSSFAWSYALFQIPSGWLVDKFGAKRSMLFALLMWSLMTLLMGGVSLTSFAFLALMVLRFFLGAMEAPVGPASARIITAWFPSSERGIAGAIFNSAQYISLVIFTPLMGWLAQRFGWEHVFVVMGSTGIVFGLLWAKLYYAPLQHPRVSEEELAYLREGGALVDLGGQGDLKKSEGLKLSSVTRLFKSRMLVGIVIAQYCITSITWFFVSWFPSYLVKGRGFSILEAGFVAAIPAVCGCIGGVSSGFVSDWLLKKTGSLTMARKLPITVGLVLSAAMILCNYVDASWMVVALMSAAFFGKGFGSLGWTVVADTAPKEVVGITGGLFGMVGNLGGIVTPVVIGYILAGTGSFNGALVFVGAHGVVAVLSYWLIVGRIERIDLAKLGGFSQASEVSPQTAPYKC